MTAEKTELAENRTSLAEDRTMLANERTFAGWLRTGFAAVGIGVGFNALFNKMEPAWAPKAIATAFLLIGILIFISAERRALAVLRRLDAHQIETVTATSLRIMTFMGVGATVALAAAIWLLRFS